LFALPLIRSVFFVIRSGFFCYFCG